jgi:hypothetical protein
MHQEEEQVDDRRYRLAASEAKASESLEGMD